MSITVDIDSENSFLARAKYPKGRQTLKAILDATYEIVTTRGLAAASQEAIAQQANVTQSAVRHYFCTKEELLLAFFTVGVERLRTIIEDKLKNPSRPAKETLLDIIDTHYEWISQTKDVYYFESASFWGRNPGFRALREEWYGELLGHYRSLLGQIHPNWTRKQRDEASYQLITLVLGGWNTMGGTRPFYQSRSTESLKRALLAGAAKIISA